MRNRNSGMLKKTRVALLGLAMMVALIPTVVEASGPMPEHDLGESYIFLYIHSDRVDARLEIATRDLNAHLGFGYEEDELWSAEAINQHVDSIRTYIDPLWELSADGVGMDFQFDSVAVRYAEGMQFALLYYSSPIATRPDAIEINYQILFDFDTRHRGLLVLTQDFESGTIDNGEVASLFFGNRSRVQVLDLSGGSWFQGFWTFIVSGAWHIWIGIDHILFLLALLFPAVLRRERGSWVAVEEFKPALINVVKIVTVFTVAHSITLIAASLGYVNLSSRIVESIIALSIAIAAFDIIRPVLHKRILVVVFVFGLFHGFGFANVLNHVGLQGSHLLLSLLGFNIGVELGQLAIVCVAFPILFLVRKTKLYRKVFLPVAAVALIALSFVWVLERFFGIDIAVKKLLFGWLGRS